MNRRRLRMGCDCCIDVHAHWFPPEWMEQMVREGPMHGLVIGQNAKGWTTIGGDPLPFTQNFPPSMIDLDCIVGSMSEARLDMRVLSLTNPMVHWAPAAFGLALARTYNDACARAYERYPDQLRGAITLPMQAPELAVAELKRAADLPGMCCVYIAMHINGANLDDERFWPVYALCEELGLPLCLHPVAPCGLERLQKYHFRNLIGNPHEGAIAAASLIFGGVLDAFPRLHVVMPHAGGSFPWIVGRFDNAVSRREEFAHMPLLPSGYLRRFYYDTISHDPQIMRDLINRTGADRIVIGTDYNFDAGYDRPVEFVELIPGLTVEERQMICGGNAMQIFPFEGVGVPAEEDTVLPGE